MWSIYHLFPIAALNTFLFNLNIPKLGQLFQVNNVFFKKKKKKGGRK